MAVRAVFILTIPDTQVRIIKPNDCKKEKFRLAINYINDTLQQETGHKAAPCQERDNK